MPNKDDTTRIPRPARETDKVRLTFYDVRKALEGMVEPRTNNCCYCNQPVDDDHPGFISRIMSRIAHNACMEAYEEYNE